MIRLLVLASAVAALTFSTAEPVAAQWQRDGTPVCTAAGDQTAPVLVRSGGGAFVIWEDGRATPSRIYAQLLNGSGLPLWPAGGIEVATRPGNQRMPVAVGDGVGGVIIAWVQEINSDNDDVYAQRFDGNGTRLWPADGAAVCAAAGRQNDLAIISDGRQPINEPPGAIIAWTDGRAGSDTDIYAQAISSAGVPRWQANGVGVCVLTGIQEDVALVTDGVGMISNPRGAIFAWRDERAGTGAGGIYSQRLNAGGTPQWVGNGIAVATGTLEQRHPCLLFVGSASAIIAWEDGRGALHTFDIYAQKVANNAVSWTPDGVPVCTAANSQLSPAIVSDGAGGALIAWRDLLEVFHPIVYMQRIDPNGVRLLTPQGVAVSYAEGGQGSPVLVPSTSGAAVVAWPDSRYDIDQDVYTQKVDVNGSAQWLATGVPACLAGGIQSEIIAVPDSTGGAIVAWTDRRSGSADIYAQRVSGAGEVVAVEAPAAPEVTFFRVSGPEPNPSAGAFELRLDLPTARAVTARVFDVNGRLAGLLAEGRVLPAGRSVLRWDGRAADARQRVPAGVYFVRIEAGPATAIRRVVMLSR